MTRVNLLLSALEGESLDEFASAMFEKLGVSSFAQRASGPHGSRCYVGTDADVEFEVLACDEPGQEDLPFCLRISAAPRGQASVQFVEELAHNVEQLVKPFGRRVARMDDADPVVEQGATSA
ncbi:MAG TPA: hypothetical protein VHA82_02600 [Ramlibacter sp.]|uniref:hypothetical protein n=1 Tax=Ramlibacter sp. TaxID=1917967 RepID=UPI002B8664F7|nr:hypothetical protein [Ramlibacter sp.]HVZ42673.1 hypothetical protein [Ramlibacter sp.]